MAVSVTEETGGTLSATGGGTEDTVWEQTTAGVYQGYIDLSNLQGEDETAIVREYIKVRAGEAYKLLNEATYYGVTLPVGGGSEGPALEMPVRQVSIAYKVTLEDDGAAKDYVYSLREIG